jgi:hypothetical protein
MSEADAALPLSPQTKEQLVTRLQRLWQSDPGNYWPALRAAGLSAKDVWPNEAVAYVPSEKQIRASEKPKKR